MFRACGIFEEFYIVNIASTDLFDEEAITLFVKVTLSYDNRPIVSLILILLLVYSKNS